MYKWNAALAALALAGCATTQSSDEARRMSLDIPHAWDQEQGTAREEVSTRWWHSFGSPELSALVEQARAQSLDVAAAVARVQQADARAAYARAGLVPEVNADFGGTRSAALDSQTERNVSTWRVGLSSSYELDFWGRQRALKDAAESSRQASVFDQETVRLTVTASVAQAWLQCVGLRERVAIAQLNFEVSERLLKLVESRARYGAATPVELAQQRGQVAAQQRVVALLRKQLADAHAVLALLSGQWTMDLVSETSLSNLAIPSIREGTPADLMTHRPDVAKAEAQLLAANANLAVARAAMLPRVTLTAGLGSESEKLRNLLENPLSSLAAGILAPIFDAGRLASNRSLAAAQKQELVVGYRKAILQAFNDVQVALNAVDGSEKQAVVQAQEVAQAQKALSLAESRYKAGADNLQTLLDVQRVAYQSRDLAVQIRQERLQASIALYRALGGGWRQAPQGPEG
ncbi:efflux transporter outer membrane subunit [Comamonas suwonensis]|uniref:efflux transporter outer membrane subunit n=1 Tax=Comamonas suwonensis TaxID=2606214 RepID=UPI00145F6D4D|nr:efflux transporter outer membrane subunit [Comamonas suwonensis]MBI1623115.1 efflux transporter outer membrane subunit [Comamonas suwonensis]